MIISWEGREMFEKERLAEYEIKNLEELSRYAKGDIIKNDYSQGQGIREALCHL